MIDDSKLPRSVREHLLDLPLDKRTTIVAAWTVVQTASLETEASRLARPASVRETLGELLGRTFAQAAEGLQVDMHEVAKRAASIVGRPIATVTTLTGGQG
ncbi:MAG: hypothetical protein Q8Q14_03515 [Gemmatimonadales bacterium]|nr:hypothetical protein [Gemmatimonadales bacterium]